MDRQSKARLKWIQHYKEFGDAGLTCRRFGVSRPTLRKWFRRHEQEGEAGLSNRSRRPHKSPSKKIHPEQEQWILELRKERKLGARRIQHELIRLHNYPVSVATIHKVLNQHNVSRLSRKKIPKHYKRYEKSLPGERVQMDTCKIAPGLYQYTAVDDLSRFMVAELYPRQTGENTLDFLEVVLDSFAVPVQVLQTDRGAEFMAMKVQQRLQDLHIKFRPTRPRSPQLNGKVERAQRTIKEEFYSWVDMDSPDLAGELGSWLIYYNYQRVHGSLSCTPSERFCSRIHDAPLWGQIFEQYDDRKERYQERNYKQDLIISKLKRSM
ncbi:MAG: IS481 family transposase [Anaerolineales bacterium]